MTTVEAIERIIKNHLTTQVVAGKVKSVDQETMTCEVELPPSPNLLDVRLRSVIDQEEKGLLIVPETGSYVLVGLIDNRRESAFVCGYSKVEKVRLLCDAIELSGNANGGLVLSEKVAQQVNEIKQDLNNLKKVFSTSPPPSSSEGSPSPPPSSSEGSQEPPPPPGVWVPVPQDGGTALKAVMSSWASQTLSEVAQTDLENEKVKHG